MADMSRIKKLLGNSTTMPMGTGIGSAQGGQNSTLLNMHTDRGGLGAGCSCCQTDDDECEREE